MLDTPSPNGRLRTRLPLVGIDQVCNAFETAWRGGRRPRIEDSLEEAPLADRPRLLAELIKLEVELRGRDGEVPVREDYSSRFSSVAVLLSPDGTTDVLPVPAEYEFGPELGRGGVGVVLRGRDRRLGRELAFKVLLPEHRERADVRQRFLQEAQVCSQLQHPNIVPVYEVGELDDGQPYITMKLVQGRTLTELLDARSSLDEGLGGWVNIFLQICKAVARAHKRGVLHRDLKPGNVMIGEFDEVQVMDWGMARVRDLATAKRGVAGPVEEPSRGPDTLSNRFNVESGVAGPVEEPVDRLVGRNPTGEGTRTGTQLGTLAYMAPEQARGEIGRLDTRCDVFGLGAILCRILTGAPPYVGEEEVVAKNAQEGNLADAFSRLDHCEADPELVELARRCLASVPEGRLRDAGEVAGGVAAWQAGVQERLRKAGLERAAAEARAEEAQERVAAETRAREAEAQARRAAEDQAAEARAKVEAEVWARRFQAGMAAAVLLLVLGGAGGGLWYQRQRASQEAEEVRQMTETRVRVGTPLEEAVARGKLAFQVRRDPARWEATLAAALAAIREGEGVLAIGRAEDELRQRVADVKAQLEQAERDRCLVERLVELRLYTEGHWLVQREQIDDHFQRAFREGGLDLIALPPDEVARQIQARDVRDDLVAALDHWAVLRRILPGGNSDGVEHLLSLANSADGDPWRRQLRDLLSNPTRAGLEELARGKGLSDQPTSSLVLLSGYLVVAGDHDVALAVLRQAQRQDPRDFWMNEALGHYYSTLARPPDWGEASRFYAVAHTLNPRSSIVCASLGYALEQRGRYEEAEAACRRAIELEPGLALAHSNLGNALCSQNKLADALDHCNRAVKLQPALAEAHLSKGRVLLAQGKYADAAASSRLAVCLAPNNPRALGNLGAALLKTGPADQAVTALWRALDAFRQAGSPAQDMAIAYTNLGSALTIGGQPNEAIAAYREAIRHQPGLAGAYYGLGNVYHNEERWREAIAAYEQALARQPGMTQARWNLLLARGFSAFDDESERPYRRGVALVQRGKPDEGIDAFREALRVKPRSAKTLVALGTAFQIKNDHDRAITAFRDALDIDRSNKAGYHGLAMSLQLQGRTEEAIRAWRKAVDLRANLIAADYVLFGEALYEAQDFKGALAEFSRAVSLDPEDARAHFDLGVTLEALGRLQDAIGSFREAITINKRYAQAHGALGRLLLRMGDFATARAATSRCLEWLPPRHQLRQVASRQLVECDRLLDLDRKLTTVIQGERPPQNPTKQVDLAVVGLRHRNCYATAARLYSGAFAAWPKLGDDHRYDAACAAALASGGQGRDAAKLDGKERARLCRQALDWLRADLAAWTEVVDKGPPAGGPAAQRALGQWQKDPALAGLRDKDALAKLPEAERKAWAQLWADVADLLKRAQQKPLGP